MYNQPESIQARNKEALAEEVRLRQEREKEKNKFKKLKRSSINKEAEQQLDVEMNDAEYEFKNSANLKFVPVEPPPKEYSPSPIGKIHTVGPKVEPEVVKVNYEGERNMIKIFEAIRKQPAGFFLYLTHTYQKSSNRYNFYNVK